MADDHDSLLMSITALPGVDCAVLFMLREPGGELEMVAQYGLSKPFADAYRRFDRESDCALKIREGSVWARDFIALMREDDNDHVLFEGIRSILAVPVEHAGRVIGSLHVASRTHSTFPSQTVSEVESVAARFAPAVRQLRPE